MKKIYLFWLAILIIMPRANGAFAASITNLDTKPYDLHVKTGGQVEQIHIEPNATWNSSAPHPEVRYQDNWMELDYDASYAIWKGGVLTRQSMGPHGRGE